MAERSITQSMFLEVRFAILSEKYLPDQILDREELCQVYGCKSAIVVDASNALVMEGYLDIPRRGVFAVRRWTAVEVNDLFDIRSAMMGMAAARAAERGTALELGNLSRTVEQSPAFDFSVEADTERLISSCADVQGAIIRMARVSTIAEMARSMGPNALFRKSVWAQKQKQLEQIWASLTKVCLAIRRRKPLAAQTAMGKFVEATRAPLLASIAKFDDMTWPEFPTITRIDCHATRYGCAFGAGGREAAMDGRVIPFGIAQTR